jgi:hypothetical protein
MITYVYAYTSSDEEADARYARDIARFNALGYEVIPFNLSPAWFGRSWLTFQKLDQMYRNRDPMLMALYEFLGGLLDANDVLIHRNGANIHPDFLSQFPHLTTIYTCSDDPESSSILSRPVAASYDLCLVANAAEVTTYQSWGANAVFWAQGSQVDYDVVGEMSDDDLLEDRGVDIVFFGALGGVGDVRRSRLKLLVETFPQAYCAGSGWIRGKIPTDMMHSFYRRARLGWNIHNSTGPINFRLYDLAAFGVCQISDCKQWMDDVFKVGEEIVAFDQIEEALDLTAYYLAHPDEARQIALKGRRRWERDYAPTQVLSTMMEHVERTRKAKER